MPTTRNKPLKSLTARLQTRGPSDFRSKLDSWFIDFAQLIRADFKRLSGEERKNRSRREIGSHADSPRTSSVPDPILPGWPQTISEMFTLLGKSGDLRFAGVVKVVRGKLSPQEGQADLNSAIDNVLAMIKYQTTAPELRWRETHGDAAAGRKLVEVMHIRNLWLHGQLPRGGLRFKTNVHHNMLITFGLAAGLNELTLTELVDFFDEFCPCGEIHSSEVMRRLREKLCAMLDRGRKAAASIAGLPRSSPIAQE
jgi:hypothetical protein